MGKSNNLHNKLKKVYERENDLNHFLKEDEIKILENINNFFVNEFIEFFSSFIKKRVKLISYKMTLGSYDPDRRIIKNSIYFNLIEILPYKKQSFIIFPYNFLSFIIDLLFGGYGTVVDNNKKIRDVTSTEFLINKRIIKFITNSFSNIYKKYFISEINFTSTRTFYDLKKSNFDFSKVFLINRFDFNLNNVEVFFEILIPKSIFKYMNKKMVPSVNSNHKNTHIEKNIKKGISFNDIYSVEIKIIAKMIGISISREELYKLSIGDVLTIKKPDKIIGFIEDKPIFLGDAKRFNEQSVVFIEKFINNNLESNKNEEYSNE